MEANKKALAGTGVPNQRNQQILQPEFSKMIRELQEQGYSIQVIRDAVERMAGG